MAETVKGTRSNGVYKVNQRTGQISYEGQYGGRGRESIRNSIRTVGARTAARTAAAFRNNTTAARERIVPSLSSGDTKVTRPRVGNSSQATINGINYSITHERTEGGTGHFRVKDTGVNGHYMDYFYGTGHTNDQSDAWKKVNSWMKNPQRRREHNRRSK